jgi:uncharacterized protein
MFSGPVLWRSLCFAPLVLVGALLGTWMNKRMSERTFAMVVYVLVFVSGVYLVVEGWGQVR